MHKACRSIASTKSYRTLGLFSSYFASWERLYVTRRIFEGSYHFVIFRSAAASYTRKAYGRLLRTSGTIRTPVSKQYGYFTVNTCATGTKLLLDPDAVAPRRVVSRCNVSATQADGVRVMFAMTWRRSSSIIVQPSIPGTSGLQDPRGDVNALAQRKSVGAFFATFFRALSEEMTLMRNASGNLHRVFRYVDKLLSDFTATIEDANDPQSCRQAIAYTYFISYSYNVILSQTW